MLTGLGHKNRSIKCWQWWSMVGPQCFHAKSYVNLGSCRSDQWKHPKKLAPAFHEHRGFIPSFRAKHQKQKGRLNCHQTFWTERLVLGGNTFHKNKGHRLVIHRGFSAKRHYGTVKRIICSLPIVVPIFLKCVPLWCTLRNYTIIMAIWTSPNQIKGCIYSMKKCIFQGWPWNHNQCDLHPSSLNGASQLLRARSFSKVHFAESKESKDRPVKPQNERRRCHVMIPKMPSATQPGRRSHIPSARWKK